MQGAVGLREERKRLKAFYGAKGIDPFEGDLLYPHLVDMKVEKQRRRSYGAVDKKTSTNKKMWPLECYTTLVATKTTMFLRQR